MMKTNKSTSEFKLSLKKLIIDFDSAVKCALNEYILNIS
jgi:hypothetical protein